VHQWISGSMREERAISRGWIRGSGLQTRVVTVVLTIFNYLDGIFYSTNAHFRYAIYVNTLDCVLFQAKIVLGVRAVQKITEHLLVDAAHRYRKQHVLGVVDGTLWIDQ
jgi:hypothetical protein